MQPGAARGGVFGIDDRLAQSCGEAIAAADDVEANAFVDAVLRFGEEIFVEDAQNAGDFGGRALPVGRGKREESQRVDAEFRGGGDDRASGLRSCAMSGGARQFSRSRPASVAVGNDGDVELSRRRRRRGLKLQRAALP